VVAGDRVRLIKMDDPDPIKKGEEGEVTETHNFGSWTQVYVRWDSGRTLSLITPPDEVEVLCEACQRSP